MKFRGMWKHLEKTTTNADISQNKARANKRMRTGNCHGEEKQQQLMKAFAERQLLSRAGAFRLFGVCQGPFKQS